MTVDQIEDLTAAASEARERMTALVGGRDSAAAEKVVPACPEWRVKDVIAHLAGTCADILAGNIDGVATDPWTGAQVDARRSTPLDAVLEEWAAAASQVEPLVPMFPGRYGRQWIADLASHEHDLRGALRAPGARDSAATVIATDFLVGWFLENAAGERSLSVIAGDRRWDQGSDEAGAGATLRGDGFELMRAVSGRRSLDQIRKLDWSEDPEPWLSAFEWGPFRPAASDLIE